MTDFIKMFDGRTISTNDSDATAKNYLFCICFSDKKPDKVRLCEEFDNEK